MMILPSGRAYYSRARPKAYAEIIEPRVPVRQGGLMPGQTIGDTFPTKYWHQLADGRVQCDVCPRYCKMHEGQRGLCFVRANRGDRIGPPPSGGPRGFCIDPIEKNPLDHFLPGTPVLSFGTAG